MMIGAAVVAVMVACPAHATEAEVKTDYLACNPERIFDRSEQLRKSGDEKGLKAFTAGALFSGTCVALKVGIGVFIEGKGKGDGVLKVRPKGSTKQFFTSQLAFE